MADFLVLEEDGTSKITLEESGGSLLLEFVLLNQVVETDVANQIRWTTFVDLNTALGFDVANPITPEPHIAGQLGQAELAEEDFPIFRMKKRSVSGTITPLAFEQDRTLPIYKDEPRPPNDELADAETLSEGVPVSGTTVGATVSVEEIIDGYAGLQRTVWYYLGTMPPNATSVSVDITITGGDAFWAPAVDMFSYPTANPTSYDDLNFHDGDDGPWPVTLTLDTPNSDYIGHHFFLTVYADDFSPDETTDEGEFDIEFSWITAAPANNNWNDALYDDLRNYYNLAHYREGPSLDSFYDYPARMCNRIATTEGATAEVGEPAHGGTAAERSVWFHWGALNENDQRIWVESDDPSAEFVISVYNDAASMGAMTLVDEDAPGGSNLPEVIISPVNVFDQYIVAVDSKDHGAEFTINTESLPPGGPAPSNDDWEDATVLLANTPVSGTTVGSTAQCNEPQHDSALSIFEGPLRSVWYKHTATQDGILKVSLSAPGTPPPGDINPRMDTLIGDTFDELELYLDDSELWGGSNPGLAVFDDDTTETMAMEVEDGVDYYFRVWAMWDVPNDFDRNFDIEVIPEDLTTPAGNDDFEDAEELDPDGDTVTGDNEGTTTEPGETFPPSSGTPSRSVWYKVTPTRDGFMTISWANVSDASAVSYIVYEGSTSAANPGLEVTNTSSLSADQTIAVEAGTTYWIKVFSRWGLWSTFDLSVSFEYASVELPFTPALNGAVLDDFDSNNGATISSNKLVTTGANQFATKQIVEHHPRGVWIRFDVERTSGDYLYLLGNANPIGMLRAKDSLGNQIFAVEMAGERMGKNFVRILSESGTVRLTTQQGLGTHQRMMHNQPMRVELWYDYSDRQVLIYIDGVHWGTATSVTSQAQARRKIHSIDFGMWTYPVSPPQVWGLSFSNIAVHDSPGLGPWGHSDEDLQEPSLVHGWSYGTGPLRNASGFGELETPVQNFGEDPVTVVPGPAALPGYALDCSITDPVTNGTKATAFTVGQGNWQDSFVVTGIYKMYWTQFPVNVTRVVVSKFMVGGFSGPFGLFGESVGRIAVGDNGDISVSILGEPYVTFCRLELDRLHQLQLQLDMSGGQIGMRINLDGFDFGTFYSGVPFGPTMGDIDENPSTELIPNFFAVGILGSGAEFNRQYTAELFIKDIAMGRTTRFYPLDTWTVKGSTIDAIGTHNLPTAEYTYDNEPEENLILNGDFDMGTWDSCGQPKYWTSNYFGPPFDIACMRSDVHLLAGGGVVTVVSDSTGPPDDPVDLAGIPNAMKFEITNTSGNVAYSPGGPSGIVGTEEEGPGSGYIPYEYGKALVFEFWVKAPAGCTVDMANNVVMLAPAIGGPTVTPGNHFGLTMNGEWMRYRQWYHANGYDDPGELNYVGFWIECGGTAGSDFLFKRFRVYTDRVERFFNYQTTTDSGASFAWIDTVLNRHDHPSSNVVAIDTTSHQLIDEITDVTDAIYMDSIGPFDARFVSMETDENRFAVRAAENYLDYTLDDIDADTVYGARLILNTGTTNQGVRAVLSNGTSRKYIATYSGRSSLMVPVAPDGQPWTIEKFNELHARFGYYDMQENIVLSSDFGALWDRDFLQARLYGAWVEVLTDGPPAEPPPCVSIIDLSRVRFLAWELGEDEA